MRTATKFWRGLLLLGMCLGVAAPWLAVSEGRAWARSAGLSAEGCNGCHNGGRETQVTITLDKMDPAPGETVGVTVQVAATNGNAAGFYMKVNAGQFALIGGEGTRLWSATGVGHSGTKRATGDVRFRVNWTAPARSGGVEFEAFALSANGDGGSRGDGAGAGFMAIAIGCAGGSVFFRDQDEDGHGTKDWWTRDCAKPMYYTDNSNDCDDYDRKRFPGNPEVCNAKDDDCNGQTDDGLPVMPLYPDADGDGHGALGSAMTMMGCGPLKFFSGNVGVGNDDCNDKDANVYAQAMEVCNDRDDNCNGRTDEGARPICGEGWCRRYGESCTSMVCTPGKPRAERCNYLDDDCDGMVDENDPGLCPDGQVCDRGDCVNGMSLPPSGGRGGTVGTGGAGGTPTDDDGASDDDDTTVDDGTANDDGPRPSSGCSLSTAQGSLASLAFAAAGLLGMTLRRRRRS